MGDNASYCAKLQIPMTLDLRALLGKVPRQTIIWAYKNVTRTVMDIRDWLSTIGVFSCLRHN